MAETLLALDPARMERIADELTAMRLRGLEELDAPTGGEQREEYSEVRALAEAYCRAIGAPIYGRAAAIYLLLQAAIPTYGVWGNPRGSQVLDLLFFASPEQVVELVPEIMHTEQEAVARFRPKGRLKAARRLTGLDDKRFNEYQRQLFEGFAALLVNFVAETVRDAATQSAADAGSADPTTAAPSNHWQALLTTILAAGLVALALILAALPVGGQRLAGPSPSRSDAPVTITGYAKCWPDPTKPVVGVWIVAANGGSGWADLQALPGQVNVAWFSRTLPNGGSYVVHIGCGGTPAHWELTLASLNGVLGSGHTFTCYDVPPTRDPAQAHCQP